MMPKIPYIAKRFRSASQDTIDLANIIIERYAAQGYVLTLRQLYYRLVAEGKIPNRAREYKRLGRLINDARLAGQVDWHAIEDRTRNLAAQPSWETPVEILRAAKNSFKLDWWANQPWRVEVWVEKDALMQVIARAANRYDVPYLSTRGYTSQSEMWRAARRVRRNTYNNQKTLVIHLADHDPSGLDMSRDAKDRFGLFGVPTEVKRIALNMDQVDQYQPPPNFAKETDSRFHAYVWEFGDESWELDALEPSVIEDLISDTIEAHRDPDLFNEMMARQDEMTDFLQGALDDSTLEYADND